MPRDKIRIANPRRMGECYTSKDRANQLCMQGLAYYLRDGQLKFREMTKRGPSDVYVNGRYEIKVVDRIGIVKRNGTMKRSFPHIQWLHGLGSKELADAS